MTNGNTQVRCKYIKTLFSKTKGDGGAASSLLLSPASWTLKQIKECCQQVWAHWQYNYWMSTPFPFLVLHKSIVASTTWTFHQTWEHILMDLRPAVRPIKKSARLPALSVMLKPPTENNEPSPACDPQLMQHASLPLPFSLTNIDVGKQERLFPATVPTSCIIANEVALETPVACEAQ